jgi:hypothetical protein
MQISILYTFNSLPQWARSYSQARLVGALLSTVEHAASVCVPRHRGLPDAPSHVVMRLVCLLGEGSNVFI